MTIAGFTFTAPGRFVFGAGRASELTDIVAGLGRRPLVVTGLRPERHADLIGSLPDAATYAVTHEPTLQTVRDGVDAARAHRADVVVGLGGGSVVDTAKAVAALAVEGGDPLDHAEVIGRGVPIPATALPLVAVPTTAGTGSEMSANAVVASPEHGVKVSLRSTDMLAAVALVDPLLTLDCPPAVTASSGLDALTQCLEAYVTRFANPLVDGLCREGLARAGASLRRAYADGSDVDARADMSLCASLSGLALANAKLGAVHGFAGPLGGMIDAAHGAICAALLPATCRVNVAALTARDPQNPALARYAEAGELLTGTPGVESLLAWLVETNQLLGIRGLAALGLDESRVDEACEKGRAASSMKGNPLDLTTDELRAVVTESL